jgi:DNA polymerase
MAGAAAALEDLAGEIRVCTRCDLHSVANRAVPGEGPADARVMLVGEAPGFNEDKQGRPFVGAAGRVLEELLGEAGLRRDEVYITNVVKHRPPNNRDPLPNELAACLPWLERQMEIINPQVIVTLGRFSLGTFFPGSMISKVHGEVREKEGRHYFAMYHPAAALHQERLRQTLLEDARTLGGFLRESRRGDQGQPASPAEGDSGEEDAPEQLSFF